jgi:hypothetical protein
MYSDYRFNCAKSDLAYSFLNNPDDRILGIEAAFLRSLLSAAAKQGRVSDQDIQRAIESSGVCDLAPETADNMIAYLWNVGDNYVGALSRQQAAELRRLHKLCLRAAMFGEDGRSWSEIAELLQ